MLEEIRRRDTGVFVNIYLNNLCVRRGGLTAAQVSIREGELTSASFIIGNRKFNFRMATTFTAGRSELGVLWRWSRSRRQRGEPRG